MSILIHEIGHETSEIIDWDKYLKPYYYYCFLVLFLVFTLKTYALVVMPRIGIFLMQYEAQSTGFVQVCEPAEMSSRWRS